MTRSDHQRQEGDGVALTYVPSSDDELRAYADMVSGDFNRYFSEITDYFVRVDDTGQAVFERARHVSKAHQAFWQRADDLGVTERAAAERPDASSGP